MHFNKEVLVKTYQGVLVKALLVKWPCHRLNKECPCWDFNKESLLSLSRTSLLKCNKEPLLGFQQGILVKLNKEFLDKHSPRTFLVKLNRELAEVEFVGSV